MRRIARIVAIAAVLFAAVGLAAQPAHAAGPRGGICHTVQQIGIRGSVCIGTDGDSIVARASFTAQGPLPPVPVRVCVVIYNADVGPVAGTCRHVWAGSTVTATAPRKSGIFVADAYVLKPFWLDFGPTPALTVCSGGCPD
jgi:hypothetical protein